ncbi:hypothetical protein [Estrella lausannensis]|uniref:Conserved putative membrane protein n=1 Tax=Estrella lausannensis TaxID=483423 RepID=A0A0H5E537_9BACT|nr:hypothetical protein [Estrella lausannensis]CRX38355.1 Conserved putative membrane protein [Estrella lausannensis]
MTIYFKNNHSIDQYKLLSPSSFDDKRSHILPEAQVLENNTETTPSSLTSEQNSGFIHSLGKTIALITMTITVIPLVVKMIMHWQNQKEKTQALEELEKLKWYGFFGPEELEPVIKAVAKGHDALSATQAFVNRLPAKDFPDASVKEEIVAKVEKGHISEALKKIKEHYQILNFYKACKEKGNLLTQIDPAQKPKVQAAFERSQRYLQDSRQSAKELKDLYLTISNLRSIPLTKSWIDSLHQRGELTSGECEQLKSLIDENDGPAFIEALKKCVAHKLKNAKEQGPNIGYYFYKEMWDVLVAIDSRKGIQSLANHLAPLFYYQNIYTKLSVIECELTTLTATEDQLAGYIHEIKNTLKEGATQLTSSVGADLILPPSFDYQFRSAVGLIRRKLTHINDQLSKLEGQGGVCESNHELCGCHHAYTAEDLQNDQAGKPNGLFPKQVVDIKKGRIVLEKKLKALEGKIEQLASESLNPTVEKSDTGVNLHSSKLKRLEIKREALIADIAALKLSEKGSPNATTKKPIVMGFTCSFGSGHKAPTAAVAKMLGSENAHFTVADGPDDILKPLCGFHKFGKMLGKEWKKSDAFAYILQKQWYWIPRLYLFISKVFSKIASLFTGAPKERPSFPSDTPEKELLRKRLLMEMPDHLMTFYHMDLNSILEVAEEMGLPTTHFATDFNAKMDEAFGSLPPTHPMFQIMVANNTQSTLDSASPVKPGDIVVTSGAVRPLFYQKTDAETLEQMREERGIDENTSTILFMGGGFGQSIDYPEKLAADMSIQDKMHLVVIAGANKTFGEHFEEEVKNGKLVKHGKFYKGSNPNITIEVAQDPATKTKNTPFFIGEAAISRYFDLADVLYTKPGGSTTLEALVKGLTTIFDNRTALMAWEEDNMRQTITLGYGIENRDEKDFLTDLKTALNKAKNSEKKGRNLPQVGAVLQQNFSKIHGKKPNSWQKSKFVHYRFDLPVKNWEAECALV